MGLASRDADRMYKGIGLSVLDDRERLKAISRHGKSNKLHDRHTEESPVFSFLPSKDETALQGNS